MRRIKLYWVPEDSGHQCDNLEPYPLSEWNEVTDEEFEFIRRNLYLLRHDHQKAIIVEEFTQMVPVIIKNIKDELKKQQGLQQEKLDKQKEAEKKRKSLAQERKIAKAKKLLEDCGQNV